MGNRSPNGSKSAVTPTPHSPFLPSSVRPVSGQACALCSLGDLRVHRPARRIHIRLRGRVLRNSPQPPAVCSAAAPNRAAHGTSGTRRTLGGVGLAPAPRADAPCAFAAFRWALSFVGGIPPPRLAPRSTAQSQNRAADVSLKLNAPPPRALPRLPCGAYFSLLPARRRVPRHRLSAHAFLLATNS